MRFRVALALCVSVIFIGWASWYRLSPVKKVQPSLALINEPSTEEGIKEFLTPRIATSTTLAEAKPLTATEMVARGLIMDYVGLEANGQATDANIQGIANKYVEGIASLNNPNKVTSLDLTIVTNTKANMDNYTKEFSKISINNSTKLNNIYKQADSNISSLSTKAPKVYDQTANDLKNIAVPLLLTQSHLDLINLHLSSAVATKAMAQTGENPAMELAGLITWNENMDQEILILKEIESLLKSNGT